jgi:hypothetical protein
MSCKIRVREFLIVTVSLAFTTLAPTLPSIGSPRAAAADNDAILYELTAELPTPKSSEDKIDRETLCLTPWQLYRHFLALSQAPLAGCYLGRASRQGDTLRIPLECGSDRATTGEVLWQMDGPIAVGTIAARSGESTFAQRVLARPLQSCIAYGDVL